VRLVSVDQKKQIKEANDILDVVSSYIPVVPAGKEHKAICPFHNDTRPSLEIRRSHQNFKCWACGAQGDVFDIVMRMEKVEFVEAFRMLADRAGIKLETTANPQDEVRGRLLRAMKWAEEKYRQCLLEDKLADSARSYLGERRLSGATVREFGLGFAPMTGDWLVMEAEHDQIPLNVLQEVGLIAERDEGRGYYDRFRDRVMFPIRDIRKQTCGFGGRILPSSPYAARGPKYYNSAETTLFKKSELIYGLDLARHAGSAAGYLAVVEGYTDVMMAHQCGVNNVVATMGTALTALHVTHLRRYSPKVVLVYDADAGGMGGVDRALELFVSQDVELAVASLPDGLDPCDLLVRPGGIDEFRLALSTAQDALDFKLNQMLAKESAGGVESNQRVVNAVLGIMALAPPVLSRAAQMRQELIVTRIAHRLGLRQETVWARLTELKSERRRAENIKREQQPRPGVTEDSLDPVNRLVGSKPGRTQPLSATETLERQLLELVLAEPDLISVAKQRVPIETIQHTGIQRMLSELYALNDAGQRADLDALRVRMIDRPDLVQAAMTRQHVGLQSKERPEKLLKVMDGFDRIKKETEQRAVKEALALGPADEQATLELLRRIQGRPSSN
jgi:DNA primase